MSATAEIVWLSQEPDADPMGEFGPEEGVPAARVDARSVSHRFESAPASDSVAAEPQTEAAPVGVDPMAGAARGRWFVLSVLALLALVQVPFVVLWALQIVNGAVPVPVPIRIERPPVAFSRAPMPPIERTVVPPPRRAAPAPRPVPAGSLSGFLRVDVPVAMRITEDGRLLGTTDVDRLMLPAGQHTLDLRNDELQFATRQTVTIKPGGTATIPVRLPVAPLSINARPWAEAWVDGERVGDTPIGTLMRTIGRHEVVLRHPELGERRVPVVITLAQPARVTVDFREGK